MGRVTTIFCLLIMSMAAIGLYRIKHDAKLVVAENSRLVDAIGRTKNDIAVLEAEWSHLNDPARIQDLAERHLGLQRLDMTQMARAADIPLRAFPAAPLNRAQLDMLIEDTITTGSVPAKTRR